MFSDDELRAFCSVLNLRDSSDRNVHQILNRLNLWSPARNQIISTGIGKCLMPLTKIANENGRLATEIVNKWKTIFINSGVDREYSENKKLGIIQSKFKSSTDKNGGDENKFNTFVKLTYSNEELERFCLILCNKESPDKEVTMVLSKLNAWNPVKSQVIASGISQSLSTLSKESNKYRTIATAIIKKWKDIFINGVVSQELVIQKFTDKSVQNSKLSTKSICSGRNENVNNKSSFDRNTYSNEDLEYFCSILKDERLSDKYVLKVLLKLNVWNPVKSLIVSSGIGKCLSKISKLPGENGVLSSTIINKWKRLLDCDIEEHKNIRKSSNENSTNADRSSTSSIWKRKNSATTDATTPKKKCLSLEDYYKRKPTVLSETIEESSANQSSAEPGMSFLDSITVKPTPNPKAKQRGPLTLSQLNAALSNQSIAQRQDIIESKDTLAKTSLSNFGIEDMFKSAPCNPRLYLPKSRPVADAPVESEKYFSRGVTNPPSLLKQCQVVLLQYKECIEEVLWTPRELLIHVLRLYTPEQLLHFESFNPQLIEENEDLWRVHYNQKNQKEVRLCDSWRESYLRMEKAKEMRMERSFTTLKSRMEDIKKEEESKKIKLLANVRRNPCPRRYYHGASEETHGNPARKLLMKRYKQMFHR